MKKLPTKAHFEFTGFMELVTDVIYHIKALSSDDGFSQHKNSRAAVIACALAVESCANCLLDSLDIPTQSSSELERLPTITKLDVCIRLHTSGLKVINRGDSRVAKMAELLKVRNEFVHPKRQTLDAEWGVDAEDPDGYRIEFEYSDKFHQQLGIPKTGLHWNSSHAISVAEATFTFFDFLFRELLQLEVGEVYHLVGSRMVAELSEDNSQMIASGPVDQYEELLTWAANSGLAIQFLRNA
ncbi:MAG: hypothetical protein V4672_11195 [Verrucomicrobiota bacterium]